MPKTTLPMPTWYKSDGNLLSKYVKFLERHFETHGTQRVHKLTTQLRNLNDNLVSFRESIEKHETVLRECEDRVNMARKQMVIFSDDQLQTEYRALVNIPEVIGTRVDAYGALVVLLRPVVAGRDLGDFEFDFTLIEDDTKPYDRVRLQCNRLPINGKIRSRFFEACPRVNHTDTSDYLIDLPPCPQRKTQLQSGKVAAIILEVLGRFNDLGPYLLSDLALRTNEPIEAAWDGYVSNPIKALRRRMDIIVNTNALVRILLEEHNLQEQRTTYGNSVGNLRTAQAELRDTKVQLQKANLYVKRTSLPTDKRQAADDLRRITTRIPGVMGVRFDIDGVALIHVRRSAVHNGKRYDLGDYVLRLEMNHEMRDAVIRTERTRTPATVKEGYRESLYWQDDDYAEPWFCFGERSKELKELFLEGTFAQFVHLAVNSMNNVNEADRRYLSQYPEIPLDEVWRPRQPRQRPRRRLRRQVVAAATH